MVLEVAVLDVRAGEEASFEAAFREAEPPIAGSPGHRRHELRRSVERAGRYLLLVWWDSLESHTEGFRGSPAYSRRKSLFHHVYDPVPAVEHQAPLVPAPA